MQPFKCLHTWLIQFCRIFFLPSSSSILPDTSLFQVVVATVAARYDLNPLSRWSLEHRLFRATQTGFATSGLLADEVARPQPTRYLQVLSMSHRPQAFVSITTTTPQPQTRAGTPATTSSAGESAGEPAKVISIPSGPSGEEFVQLTMSKLGPLWTPRQILTVINGQHYEVGEFRVRMGEVRQGQGGVQQIRGVAVEVEWNGGAEDLDVAEDEIKSFWAGLEFKGTREFFRVPGAETDLANVRQWCEALRLRA